MITEKYLVLSLTNGDGYTEPSFELFASSELAVSSFNEIVGQNVIDGLIVEDVRMKVLTSERACMFISKDEDGDDIDNYGVHLIPCLPGDKFLINTDFVDEIVLQEETSDGIFADNGIEFDEEPTIKHECLELRETHVTDIESGTHYVLIEIL